MEANLENLKEAMQKCATAVYGSACADGSVSGYGYDYET